MKYWRYLWAFPATLVGLLLAALALRRGRVRVVDGVIEAHGPWVRWVLTRCVPLRGGAAAITFGHVVVAQNGHELDCTRAHERVHVRQYERWGVAFLPAYVVASAYAAILGRHYYLDNAFEREAFAARHAADARASGKRLRGFGHRDAGQPQISRPGALSRYRGLKTEAAVSPSLVPGRPPAHAKRRRQDAPPAGAPR